MKIQLKDRINEIPNPIDLVDPCAKTTVPLKMMKIRKACQISLIHKGRCR